MIANFRQIIVLFKSITIFEIVLTTVVAVALGVAFWGWTFVYELAKPFLRIGGLSYLISGFWIFPSIFLSQIIRKPGIALTASVLAAFVESLLTHWGLFTLLWGVAQGLGAEFIFICFAYRNWNLKVLIIASIFSASMSYYLDFFIYNYYQMSIAFNIIQLLSFLISATFLAGVLSARLSKRLLRLGILDQFLIAKE